MIRFTLTVDSATTEEIRALMVGLHRAGHTQTLKTGVNGPDCWAGTTPPLFPHEFDAVLDELRTLDMVQ